MRPLHSRLAPTTTRRWHPGPAPGECLELAGPAAGRAPPRAARCRCRSGSWCSGHTEPERLALARVRPTRRLERGRGAIHPGVDAVNPTASARRLRTRFARRIDVLLG